MAIYKLGSISKIIRGNSPRPIQDWLSDEGLMWAKIPDISNYSMFQTKEYIKPDYKSKAMVGKKGDLFLTNSATPGIPFFQTTEDLIAYNDAFLKIDVNSNIIDKHYLLYKLILDRPRLLKHGNGAVFINLSTQILKDWIIDIPTLKEQQHIIDIIEPVKDLFLKYSNAVRINTFDNCQKDIKTLIDIIKPIEDSLKNINDQILSIKNILVNNYKRCTSDRRLFADYIELKYNKYANQEDYLATNAVGEFQIDFTKKQNVLDSRPSRANLTPVKDSIIISKLDGENKIVYIDDNFKYVVSTGFYNFKTKHLDHVIGFLLSEDFKKQKTLLSTGTTMVGLNNDSLNKIIFNKPDSENKQFTLQLNNLINMQVGLIQQRDRMIELLIK